jgi:hypothetical protein
VGPQFESARWLFFIVKKYDKLKKSMAEKINKTEELKSRLHQVVERL